MAVTNPPIPTARGNTGLAQTSMIGYAIALFWFVVGNGMMAK